MSELFNATVNVPIIWCQAKSAKYPMQNRLSRAENITCIAYKRLTKTGNRAGVPTLQVGITGLMDSSTNCELSISILVHTWYWYTNIVRVPLYNSLQCM